MKHCSVPVTCSSLVRLLVFLCLSTGCRGVFSTQGFDDDTDVLKSSSGDGPIAGETACQYADRYLSETDFAVLARDRDAYKRTIDLYVTCPGRRAPQIFARLAGFSLPVDATWRIAVALPSPAMTDAIGKVLSNAVASKNDSAFAQPVVADAIRVNKVPDSYTFLRRSLATSNASAFVEAMLVADPARASDDLLTHLAKLPFDVSEAAGKKPVRGIRQTIIENLLASPPSLQHPNFGHLFLFAASEHAAIAAAARQLITKLCKSDPDAVAVNFAKQSEAVQLALLDAFSEDEDSRVMLVSLRGRSPFEAVVQRLAAF